jgi:hypothetical protein
MSWYTALACWLIEILRYVTAPDRSTRWSVPRGDWPQRYDV